VGWLDADPNVINELPAKVGGVGQDADTRGADAKIGRIRPSMIEPPE
jgi:hypothetical protein